MNFTKKRKHFVQTKGYGSILSYYNQPSAGEVTGSSIDDGLWFLPTRSMHGIYKDINLKLAEEWEVEGAPKGGRNNRYQLKTIDRDYLTTLDSSGKATDFTMFTQEEATRILKEKGFGDELKVDGPISNVRLNNLIYGKTKEQKNRFILSKAKGARWFKGLALQLATALIDPINVPLSMISVLNAPSWGVRMLRNTSRVKSSGLIGAYGGAVTTGIADAPVYFQAQQEQLEYDMTNVAINIAFGAVIGGTIGTAVGFFGGDFRLANAAHRDHIGWKPPKKPSKLMEEAFLQSKDPGRTRVGPKMRLPSVIPIPAKWVKARQDLQKVASKVFPQNPALTRSKIDLAQEAIEKDTAFNPETLDIVTKLDNQIITRTDLRTADRQKHSLKSVNNKIAEIHKNFEKEMKAGGIFYEVGEPDPNLPGSAETADFRTRRREHGDPDVNIETIKTEYKRQLKYWTNKRESILHKVPAEQRPFIEALAKIMTKVTRLHELRKEIARGLSIREVVKTGKLKEKLSVYLNRAGKEPEAQRIKTPLDVKDLSKKKWRNIFRLEEDRERVVKAIGLLNTQKLENFKNLRIELENIIKSFKKHGIDSDELMSLFDLGSNYSGITLKDKKEKIFSFLTHNLEEAETVKQAALEEQFRKDQNLAEEYEKMFSQDDVEKWFEYGIGEIQRDFDNNKSQYTADEKRSVFFDQTDVKRDQGIKKAVDQGMESAKKGEILSQKDVNLRTLIKEGLGCFKRSKK